MKNEIEARLLDCNVDKFVNSLQKAGATFVGDWMQIRYCYDFDPIKPNINADSTIL